MESDNDSRGLRALIQASDQTLVDARAGLIDIADAVAVLEALCTQLKAELDGQPATA